MGLGFFLGFEYYGKGVRRERSNIDYLYFIFRICFRVICLRVFVRLVSLISYFLSGVCFFGWVNEMVFGLGISGLL